MAQEFAAAGSGLHAAEAAAAALTIGTVPATVKQEALAIIYALIEREPLLGHAPLQAAVRTDSHSAGFALASHPQLTPRESEIAKLIDAGLGNQEIADHLTLSIRTVEGHITRLYRKTGAERRAPGRRKLME